MNMDIGGVIMSIYKQQREQIKRSILDTSVSIFREKGYEYATIDEITRTVGVAKGTFYNFYASKSEILITWAAEKFLTIQIQEVFNIEHSLEENLYKFVEILIDAINEDEQLFKSLLKELLHTDKKYSSQFDFLKIYRRIIENSNDGKRVNGPLLDIKIDVLNHSLFMGIVSWFDSGNTAEGLYQYLINVTRICLHGILGDKEE
jgi:AcrR family transcriptional regulator